MRSRLLRKYSKGEIPYFKASLIIICIGTGGLSYSGYASLWPGLEGKLMAAIIAVVTVAALYLYHSFVIDALTDDAPIRNRLLIAVLALVCFIFIAGLSSMINVAAISGKSAQVTYLDDFANECALIVSRAYDQANAVRKFVPFLEQERSRWSQAAEDELSSGAYSGHAGYGSVHTVLNNYALRFEQLHAGVQRYLTDVEAHYKQAHKELAAIQAVIRKHEDPELLTKSVAAHTDRLRKLVTQMSGKPLAEALHIAMESLPGETGIITLSSNSKIAREQQRALEKIGSGVGVSTELLTEILEEYSAQGSPELPALENMTTLRAVIVYWYAFPQSWLAGIGLDFLPIFLALILMLLDLGLSQPERLHHRRMSMEAQDMLNAMSIMEQLRRLNIDPHILKHLNDTSLGLEQNNDENNH